MIKSLKMNTFEGLLKLLHANLKFKTSNGQYEGVMTGISFSKNCVCFKHLYLLPNYEYLGEKQFQFTELLAYMTVEELPGTNSLTMKKIFKDFSPLMSAKVRFITRNGKYEGVVSGISYYMKRLYFKNVYLLPDNKYLEEENFHYSDFLSYIAVQELAESDIENCSILNQSISRNSSISSCDYSKELKSVDSTHHDNSYRKKIALNLPPNLHDILPSHYVILEKFDLEYQQAINVISQQRSVGVSFEGIKTSSPRKIYLVCISTEICVFLFDIEKLGKIAFDNGLRDIFLNEKINKVVYNFRQSYCLLEQYSTLFKNLYDPFEVDFLIQQLLCGGNKNSLKLSTLEECVETYLEVPKEFLYDVFKKYNLDEKFYSERPIDSERFNFFLKNVIYLLLLREKLLKILPTLVHGTSKVSASANNLIDKQNYALASHFSAIYLDDKSCLDEKMQMLYDTKQTSIHNNTDSTDSTFRKILREKKYRKCGEKNNLNLKYLSDSNNSSSSDINRSEDKSSENQSNTSHGNIPAKQLIKNIYIPAGMNL